MYYYNNGKDLCTPKEINDTSSREKQRTHHIEVERKVRVSYPFNSSS